MITGDVETDELMKYVKENCDFFDGEMHFYSEIKCLLPIKYRDFEEKIRNLTVCKDDVWVLSFPKCGTTWTQEMVWLIANNLDYKGAEVELFSRFPLLEYAPVFGGRSKQVLEVLGNTVDIVEQMQRPRYIRSHLPLALLPTQLAEKKPKIVYVMRDPKDAAVSLYYHYTILHAYEGSIEKFFEACMKGATYYGCYFHHIAAFWKFRHEPNILILTYEEIKKDLPSVIKRTAGFLNKCLTDQQVATLAEHLSFTNMRKNAAVNFKASTDALRSLHKKSGRNDENVESMRKEVVDYRNNMSPEMVKKFEEWIREKKRLLGLVDDKDFPY